ncbi:hypothetical protein CGRA01v4_14012 [Colletotrichum graminicola]|uniref:Transmembrane protein n=1 Tax=Colletotrichum graminicola (strain M1.001 / M2 / FGSC 10212) TaxID=645133 RepID=E3QYE9_COLGM|nr:uncharacterized protein GLRG_11078 [Colletotrichum graminicola M1.001]EFQ35887.1 hypothetical protein GLRG_11078 [Colletotrichum graminicola M1.001]WDK22722.1 hypothetical protein CGRA01v4_14012 [Colletotrichum graminicola]
MASPSSRDEGVQINSFTAVASDQQTSSFKTRSNEPGRNKGKGPITRNREKSLVRLCSSRGAMPTIPEIRVKGPDSRDVRIGAGGSVSPSSHPQSTDHLQVPNSSKPRAQQKQQTVQAGVGRKRTFLGFVDCALGLQHVRTCGDHEPLVGRRYRAKRNTFRIIALFGVLMMLSLAASITLFVYFASTGGAGPEWFAWIAISAAGWICSLLAFIMAKQSERRALHDVEIARQSTRLSSRVQDGTAAPVAIVGGPGANRQHVMPAGSSAATGAPPAVFGRYRALEFIHEEDEALDAEHRLDMLVANQRPRGGGA